MTDALIIFMLSLLLLDAAARRLSDYLAALDGQMEAETTEEQP